MPMAPEKFDSEEVMVNVEIFRAKLKKAAPILDGRYSECDDLGRHQKPNQETGYCDYCYRHLEYKLLMVDAQRSEERFQGLRKLAEELNL